MSTELATTTPKPAFVTATSAKPIIPGDFDSIWRMSGMIHASGMQPQSFNTVEKVAVALIFGMEVGLTPMQALQSIAVINGKPGLYGDAAMALVRASGACEYVKEWFEGEGDQRSAVCEAKRKGGEVRTVRFSVADAKKAKLWNKSGPWTDYPDRMQTFRARSWCLRDLFADILRGFGIVEELQDIPSDKQPPAPPKPPVRETVDESDRGAPQQDAPVEDKKPAAASGPPAPPKSAAKSEQTIDADPFDEELSKLDKAMAQAGNEDEMKAVWKARPKHGNQDELERLVAIRDKHKARLAEKEAPQEDGDANDDDGGTTGGDGFDPKAFRDEILERLKAATSADAVDDCLAEVEAAIEAGQISENDKAEHLEDAFADAIERTSR